MHTHTHTCTYAPTHMHTHAHTCTHTHTPTHTEPKSPAKDIKYYTLNRRPKKNPTTADPLKDFTHNIEVDSRLRTDARSRALSFGSKEKGTKSTGDIRRQKSLEGILDNGSLNGVSEEDKKHARDILTQKIGHAAEIEKRNSNGIMISPVSTKGEVTMTQSTKASLHTTSPLTERRKFTQNSSSPMATIQKPSPPPADVTSQPKTEQLTKRETTSEIMKRNSLPPKLVQSDPEERAPLLRQSSGSSSGTFSPSSELRYIHQGPSSSREGSKEPDRGSSASEELYDRLEAVSGERSSSFSGSDSTNSRSASVQYTRLSESEERSRNSASPGSEGSGVYDHLPPAAESHSKAVPDQMSTLSPPTNFLLGPRRNISQPALSTPASARESPVSRERSVSPLAEESSGEEVGTPTNR